jgi:hypothetical protein
VHRSVLVSAYETLTRFRKTLCTVRFQMSFNLLAGTVPTEMGRLTNLREFEYIRNVLACHRFTYQAVAHIISLLFFVRQLYSELVVIF